MELGTLWGLMTVIGPIVLAAVIIWAILNNCRSPEEDARTDAATQRMYDEQDREDKANENL